MGMSFQWFLYLQLMNVWRVVFLHILRRVRTFKTKDFNSETVISDTKAEQIFPTSKPVNQSIDRYLMKPQEGESFPVLKLFTSLLVEKQFSCSTTVCNELSFCVKAWRLGKCYNFSFSAVLESICGGPKLFQEQRYILFTTISDPSFLI